MRNTTHLVVGLGVALVAIAITPTPFSACSVFDLVVWNPYWDCGDGGPAYHRWPDWKIFSYSVHPAEANLDWITPVVGGFAGMDGANDKATFVWSSEPADNVVLFDYDGTLWPWQPTQLANNTLSINPCGGYFTGNWTVRYNVFHNPDFASTCNDTTWDVGTEGVHEAGHVNGLGGHAVQACSTSTVMATPRTRTHCFYGPLDLDQEAISLLYTAIPASNVLWFRVKSGIATWFVDDQVGAVAWRIDGPSNSVAPWEAKMMPSEQSFVSRDRTILKD